MNTVVLTVTLLIVMAGLVMAVVWRVWQHVRRPGKSALYTFVAFSVGTAWWCVAYALEIVLPTVQLKLLAAKAQYLGIVSAPLGWALFVHEYTRRGERLPPTVWRLMALLPALTLVFVWMYPAVPLVWRAHVVRADAVVPVLQFTYGPWFWVHVGYSYFYMLFGAYHVVRFTLRRPEMYRGQAASLLLTVFFPWVANFIYLFGRDPLPGLDLTPFAFGLSALAIMWGLFRHRLFRVVPVAREAVIRSSPTGVLVFDLEGRLVDINPAAARFLGVDEGRAVVGLRFDEVLPEELGVLLEGERTQEWQVVVGKEQRFLNAQSAFLWTAQGEERLGTVVTLHDVTELRRTTLELARVRDAAEAANRAKSTFLANMSHELRTPLAVIIGYAEMAQEDVDAGEYGAVISSLERIQQSSHHLLALIGQILDMVRIEAGKVDVDVGWFDGDELIQAVVADAHTLARRQHNEFHAHIVPVGPMYSDRAKVRQILHTLLENAAKFTHEGRIALRVTVEQDASGHEWVCFRVSDTGVGIAPDRLEAIFRPFEQADTSMTRHYGGIGLGLPIARHFCELLGGSIHVESVPGGGSTFTVRLPKVAPASGEEAPEASPESETSE